MQSNNELLELNQNNEELFWDKFNDISYDCNNFNPLYCREFYNYQKEYCISNKSYVSDKSFIIFNENKPVSAALFILCKRFESNVKEISFGENFPGILLITNDITNKSLDILKETINNFFQITNKIIFTLPQFNYLNSGYNYVLNKFRFSQAVNWTKSITTENNADVLWSNIRKSYKSPINKGLRQQEFELIDFNNLNYERFKSIEKFHHEISGRKTRSSKTWALQYSLIKKDKSFAIISFDKKTFSLNCAVYFYKSQKHAYYGTGIFSDQSKKNLYAYSIIWKAILYCQQRNITICELDENIKFKWMNGIEKKLIDLSFFKSGFGGVLIPRLIFTLTNKIEVN